MERPWPSCEIAVKPPLLRAIAWTGLAVAVLAAGAALGILVGEEGDRVGVLEREAAALREANAALQAERDRLRIERDEFEARLAAARAPAVCPQDEVSTADADLLATFEVLYPCGWHVVLRAAERTPQREGLVADIVLFSRLPIALAPGPRPPADVELADWSDDAADERDALEPIARWLDDERETFAGVTSDEPVEVGDGIEGRRIAGTIRVGGEETDVIAVLWEYTDALAGGRHVVRLVTISPSARVRSAVARMVRTFRPLPR